VELQRFRSGVNRMHCLDGLARRVAAGQALTTGLQSGEAHGAVRKLVDATS
jgi:hypothetical protein